MSSKDERARDWLEDIVEDCDRIAAYLAGLSFAELAGDDRTRDAVERCLQRITEAAVRLGAERLARIAPGLPFEQVRGLGNLLRHEYDRIDPRLIWHTASQDLPPLRAACEAAIGEDRR